MSYLINPYKAGVSGYTPVFTPPSITSANYVNWVEARHEGLSNNDPVAIAHDQSGGGYHWEQGVSGERPTYISNQLNGHGIFRFDGSNDSLILATNILSGKSAGAIFIVLKVDNDPPSASAQSGLWNMDGESVNAVHYPFTNSELYEAWGSDSRKATGVNPTPSLASWRLYNVETAASSYKIRLDGTEIFSTTTNNFSSFSDGIIYIGRSASLFGDIYFDGDMAGWCIVDAVPNSTDRDTIENQWGTTYGLTIA